MKFMLRGGGVGDNEWDSSWPRGLARRGGLARRPQGDEGPFFVDCNQQKQHQKTYNRNILEKLTCEGSYRQEVF